MKSRVSNVAAFGIVVFAGLAVASEQMCIPQGQINEKKIFAGSSAEFEHPAEVEYEKVIQATPEYHTLKRAKLERGTGKYWILMSQASERGVKAIQATAEKQGYDLVCAAGYLGGLNPPVAADDITDGVVDAVPAAAK